MLSNGIPSPVLQKSSLVQKLCPSEDIEVTLQIHFTWTRRGWYILDQWELRIALERPIAGRSIRFRVHTHHSLRRSLALIRFD
jgi:hypothetical protein